MPSALGEGATAARAPGAPPAPALVGANRSAVTLAWAAPSADGGSPILGYAAELQPKSAAAVEDGMPVDWVLVYQARPTGRFISMCACGKLSSVWQRRHSLLGRLGAGELAQFSSYACAQGREQCSAWLMQRPPAARRAVCEHRHAVPAF